jgi:lysophospholipase L1-like esterase
VRWLSRIALLIASLGCGHSPTPFPKQPGVVAGTPPSPAPPTRAAVSADPESSQGLAGLVATEPGVAQGGPAQTKFGSLEGANQLSRVFELLSSLEDGRAHDDVRILQYGDSHTASDTGTSAYRRLFQARFGDGGRGFVSIGKPWKTYFQTGIRGGMSSEFEPQRLPAHDGVVSGDPDFGLLGVAVQADRPGARAWTRVTVPTSHVEVAFWQQQSGGSADLFVDGALAGRIATRAAQPGSGFFGIQLTDAPHDIELRAVGDGDVRVFGMTLDRARMGVVVDALGINGAQIYTLLRRSEDHFAEQLRHRAPDLVVLAYGTNEALDPKLDPSDYERALVKALARVARAVPDASCLLLGPPDLARPTALLALDSSALAASRLGPPEDRGVPGARASLHSPEPARPPLIAARGWSSWPPVADIIAVQRRVAEAAGCAFYDQMDAMGGAGTMVSWASEAQPRGQSDRVHFTQTGYAQLATSFASDFLHAYDDWRGRRGVVPGTGRTRDGTP